MFIGGGGAVCQLNHLKGTEMSLFCGVALTCMQVYQVGILGVSDSSLGSIGGMIQSSFGNSTAFMVQMPSYSCANVQLNPNFIKF